MSLNGYFVGQAWDLVVGGCVYLVGEAHLACYLSRVSRYMEPLLVGARRKG